MKHIKKVVTIALAFAMVLAMSVTVFAATQTVPASPTSTDNATITINNPSKGQTYKAFKLFDATVKDGKIAYKGTVPSGMGDYFKETSEGSGYVTAKPAAFKTVTYYTDKTKTTVSDDPTEFWTGEGMSTGLEAAIESWVVGKTALAQAESDGSDNLEFTKLPYGYYVITTDHEDQDAAKCFITVDSTNPNATVYDKNVNKPSAKKEVNDDSYTVGDFVEYVADFDTTNYLKDGNGKSWQVIEYTISDTLPAFLDSSTVQVTKLTIDGTDYKLSGGGYPQFENKKIVIPWATKGADDEYTNIYDNGVKIHVEYKAKLTSAVKIEGENINTISINPKVTDGSTEKPWEESWDDDAVITTYATALKKTDGTTALAGAHFMVKGLEVEKTADGVYTVVSYDPTSTADGTDMEVDENGMLYIIGLKKEATLAIEETVAPEGYNKLTGTTNLSPQVLGKEIYKKDGYRKYDAKGNIIEEVENETTDYVQVTKNLSELDAAAVPIVNEQGIVLPGTGGIGTVIFYVLGAALLIGCGVVLVSKRRMTKEK